MLAQSLLQREDGRPILSAVLIQLSCSVSNNGFPKLRDQNRQAAQESFPFLVSNCQRKPHRAQLKHHWDRLPADEGPCRQREVNIEPYLHPAAERYRSKPAIQSSPDQTLAAPVSDRVPSCEAYLEKDNTALHSDVVLLIGPRFRRARLQCLSPVRLMGAIDQRVARVRD